METRRLHLLLLLSRLGSMRAVAEAAGTTTSTVSQQLAALAREVGATLIEPDGRRVRLTPAGRRLAQHAVTVLAAVEVAYRDLDPDGEPAGTLRVAGFATAIRHTLVPIARYLAQHHPHVRLLIYEHEPREVVDLLTSDEIDLGLTYDYNLAPATMTPPLQATPLWTRPWGLGVPSELAPDEPGSALAVFERFRTSQWIGNSRNTADERVVRTIASMAGFEPRISHQADSLSLVADLIVAGMGVGLLPADTPATPGVRLVPLADPDVRLRAYALTRQGTTTWPPLALVLSMLHTGRARVTAHEPEPT